MKRIFSNKTLILTGTILILFLSQLPATGINYPGNWLELGITARALGMANAYTAISDDPGAINFNSAGLGQIDRLQISGMYITLFEGSQYHYLSCIYHFFNQITLGVGTGQLTSPIVQGRDELNYPTVTFQETNRIFTLATGYNISPIISVGISLKQIQKQFLELYYTGYTTDVSLLYRQKIFTFPLRFGLNLRNLIPLTITRTYLTDYLPFQINLGISTSVLNNFITCALELRQPTNYPLSYALGCELKYRNFYVRVGYTEGTFTTGLSISYKKINLDYALLPHPLNFSHRFSLTIPLGKSADEIAALARKNIQLQQEIQERIKKGEQYLTQGDIVHAETELHKILTLEPKNIDALNSLNLIKTILTDNTTPLLTLENPLSDTTFLNLSTYTINGFAEDNIGLNKITVFRPETFHREEIVCLYDKTKKFTIPVKLNDGKNTFYLEVTDLNRNVRETEFKLVYDNWAPEINVLSPQEGVIITTNTINVLSKFVDTTGLSKIVINSLEYANLTEKEKEISQTIPLLLPENVITITATDQVGNTSTVSRKILYITEKTPVAVLEFTNPDGTVPETAIISEMLRTELNKNTLFLVTSKPEIDIILSSTISAQTGITESDRIINFGKTLGVKHIISGTLSSETGKYYLHINMINVNTNELNELPKFEFENVATLNSSIENIVSQIKNHLFK